MAHPVGMESRTKKYAFKGRTYVSGFIAFLSMLRTQLSMSNIYQANAFAKILWCSRGESNPHKPI